VYIYDNILLNSSKDTKYFKDNVYGRSKHIFYFDNFCPENGAVYAVMWKHTVEGGTCALYK
jgi:hypothetical protein